MPPKYPFYSEEETLHLSEMVTVQLSGHTRVQPSSGVPSTGWHPLDRPSWDSDLIPRDTAVPAWHSAPAWMKGCSSPHRRAHYVGKWIHQHSPPARRDIAWSQSPFISLPGCFQLLTNALGMSLSVCGAPYISLQNIKLSQKKETYLALMMYAVSFFCLTLLLFNELNIHWMN